MKVKTTSVSKLFGIMGSLIGILILVLLFPGLVFAGDEKYQGGSGDGFTMIDSEDVISLNGVATNTIYKHRGGIGDGSTVQASNTMTLNGNIPLVSTDTASPITENTATLTGTLINSGGESCQYRFEYGTVSGVYTFQTSWTGNLASGQGFNSPVSGLSSGTLYYFRAQCQNSNGTGSGSEQSFITSGAASTLITATGTGTATFTTNAGTITNLSAAASTPCIIPAGLSFPHGFFSFTIDNITPGSAVTITITLPSNVPADTQYWKCINGQWVDVTSFLGDNDGDNVLTLTITDGGTGDADGLANGSISDPGGPVIPSAPAQPKPFAESSSAPQLPERFITSPAKLSVKYLNVQPQQSQANQPVTIYANIANGGDEAGNYTATLKVNGQVEETRTGRVGGHAAVPLKFEVFKNTPGIYNVDINGQKSSFTVIGTSSDTDNSRAIPLIGFILCAIGVIVVSALLVLRRRNT